MASSSINLANKLPDFGVLKKNESGDLRAQLAGNAESGATRTDAQPNVGALGNLIPDLSFDRVMSEALAAVHAAEHSDQVKLRKKSREKKGVGTVDQVGESPLYAQGVPTGVQGAAGEGDADNLNKVPLQMFLNKAVLALDNISRQEFRVNNLITDFIEGRVNEDEVVVETAKFNLQMTMIVSIIQTAVQEFKQITQIPL